MGAASSTAVLAEHEEIITFASMPANVTGHKNIYSTEATLDDCPFKINLAPTECDTPSVVMIPPSNVTPRRSGRGIAG